MNKKSRLLIAPLLVAPFLANCGGGSTEYKVSIPELEGVNVYPKQAIKGKDYAGTIEIDTSKVTDKLLPDTLTKVTSGNKEIQPKEYTYTPKEDKVSAEFKIPAANIVGDVAIQLTLVDKPQPEPTKKWFEYEDWWNYCSNGVEGSQATEADIGKEVIVKVDNVDQKVRLIGVDHKGTPHIEKIKDKVEAHCTFEFANVFTITFGMVPATVWNGIYEESESGNNYHFPSSVLNNFLNGAKESKDDYVLKMLPDDLQKAIKTVTKEVSILSKEDGEFSIDTYDTKLFPLSRAEITEKEATQHEDTAGSTYAFYTGKSDTDDNRIKKAVGSSSEDSGNFYWLRSPFMEDAYTVSRIRDDGCVDGTLLYLEMNAVAPAFCI